MGLAVNAGLSISNEERQDIPQNYTHTIVYSSAMHYQI